MSYKPETMLTTLGGGMVDFLFFLETRVPSEQGAHRVVAVDLASDDNQVMVQIQLSPDSCKNTRYAQLVWKPLCDLVGGFHKTHMVDILELMHDMTGTNSVAEFKKARLAHIRANSTEFEHPDSDEELTTTDEEESPATAATKGKKGGGRPSKATAKRKQAANKKRKKKAERERKKAAKKSKKPSFAIAGIGDEQGDHETDQQWMLRRLSSGAQPLRPWLGPPPPPAKVLQASVLTHPIPSWIAYRTNSTYHPPKTSPVSCLQDTTNSWMSGGTAGLRSTDLSRFRRSQLSKGRYDPDDVYFTFTEANGALRLKGAPFQYRKPSRNFSLPALWSLGYGLWVFMVLCTNGDHHSLGYDGERGQVYDNAEKYTVPVSGWSVADFKARFLVVKLVAARRVWVDSSRLTEAGFI
jgi:hypothetical protein